MHMLDDFSLGKKKLALYVQFTPITSYVWRVVLIFTFNLFSNLLMLKQKPREIGIRNRVQDRLFYPN